MLLNHREEEDLSVSLNSLFDVEMNQQRQEIAETILTHLMEQTGEGATVFHASALVTNDDHTTLEELIQNYAMLTMEEAEEVRQALRRK